MDRAIVVVEKNVGSKSGDHVSLNLRSLLCRATWSIRDFFSPASYPNLCLDSFRASSRYRQDGQKQMPAGTVSKAGDGQRPIYDNDCLGPRYFELLPFRDPAA